MDPRFAGRAARFRDAAHPVLSRARGRARPDDRRNLWPWSVSTTPSCRHTYPEMSTVAQQVEKMAAMVDLLMERLAGRSVPALTLFPTRSVVRARHSTPERGMPGPVTVWAPGQELRGMRIPAKASERHTPASRSLASASPRRTASTASLDPTGTSSRPTRVRSRVSAGPSQRCARCRRARQETGSAPPRVAACCARTPIASPRWADRVRDARAAASSSSETASSAASRAARTAARRVAVVCGSKVSTPRGATRASLGPRPGAARPSGRGRRRGGASSRRGRRRSGGCSCRQAPWRCAATHEAGTGHLRVATRHRWPVPAGRPPPPRGVDRSTAGCAAGR